MLHPLLYEINTRCWLNELTARNGQRVHLGCIPDAELDEWQRLGFSHIWLMGVWTTSRPSREQALSSSELQKRYDRTLPDWEPEDVAGSPYAIREYNVPSELGGNEGLAEIRRRLNERGMRLILDFVPNHVGLDHSWLTFWPELFVPGRPGSVEAFKFTSQDNDFWIAHGKDPYFPAWVDTAQLDYRRADTHRAVLDTLRIIADQCDGVRCDMAMLILFDIFRRTWKEAACTAEDTGRDFWTDAIPAIKEQHPEFTFIAEAYWDREQELQHIGFDFTYDKWLYDHLVNDAAEAAHDHLTNADRDFVSRSVHFLENHDEPRIAAQLDWDEHRAAAVLNLCLPGMRLLHEGQLTGARKHLPVQLGRRPDEPEDDSITAHYEWLLKAIKATAIGPGDGIVLTPFPAWSTNETHRQIVAVQWQLTPDEFDIVVVNLADHDAQCVLQPEIPGIFRSHWRMDDLLSEASYTKPGAELMNKGLYLGLTAHAAHIYHFTQTSCRIEG